MTADEMVAYALEAPPELLPFLPELLADLEELGSDAEQIAHIVRDLGLPGGATVVDLGCGKGATARAIAAATGHRVLGIDLFEPFVVHATITAAAAGLSHLCEFRHGDVRALAGTLPPADVVIYAALGDVLGDPAETMATIRRYARPGGTILVSDVFLRDASSPAASSFPGFEHYRTRAETVAALTACGDRLVGEATDTVATAGAPDDEPEPQVDDEAITIRRRALAIAARHPELREALLAFAAYQADAEAHIREHLVDAVWMIMVVGR